MSDCRRTSTFPVTATSPTSGPPPRRSPGGNTPSNQTSGPSACSCMRYSAGVRRPIQVPGPQGPGLQAGWEGPSPGHHSGGPRCSGAGSEMSAGAMWSVSARVRDHKLPGKGGRKWGVTFRGRGGTGQVATGPAPAASCPAPHRHVQPRGLPAGGRGLPHALPAGVPAHGTPADALVLAQRP